MPRLTISFDLDSTLIPCGHEFEVEPRGLRARLLRAEPIRRGTVALFEVLRKRGCDIWIFTTSHRSPRSIRRTLRGYGLRVSGVVNGERSRRVLEARGCTASKHPGLFGIDVHVDDAEGVVVEGEQYGFTVVWVAPGDAGWAEVVLRAVLIE